MLGSYAIMRSDSVISDNQENDNNGNDNGIDNNIAAAPKEENPNAGESAPRSRINWTDEETEKFLSLRAQHPDMSWEVLQEKHFPDRTVGALKGKLWRITADAETKKRKRSPSASSSDNRWGVSGDIPFESSYSEPKQPPGLSSASQLAHTARNSLRKLPQSTAKRTGSSTQPAKSARYSLPNTASFSAPVNKPPIKRGRESPIELSDHDVPAYESTDDGKGDSRVQLALQLLDPKLWNQIYHEARKCESERRRADNAVREKAALEAELRDVKARLKKMEKYAHKPNPNPSKFQSPRKEPDPRRAQRLKVAWETVSTTCKDYISFTNWEAAGMSEAMKVVQGEIEDMTKAAGSESPPSSPNFSVDGHEHDDPGDNVMGNLQRLFDET
ncbi:hypothetical protein FQN54_003057 [Arachnomyces sp. PD_36]|nr:hypothetical protein FQN54_003057 [Arachnomyces sp. PD_36]